MDLRPPHVPAGRARNYGGVDCSWTAGRRAARTGPWIIRARTAIFRTPSAASPASTRGRRKSPSTWTTATFTTGPGSTASRWATGISPTSQAPTLREFLLRGGFFMCDDFHGAIEWDIFVASMRKVFPDRPIVEIDNDDPIFHTIYDLDRPLPGAGRPFIDTGTHLREGRNRQDAALARHLRRQGPHHGGHVPQHGPGRFLGARRQPRNIPRAFPTWASASASTTSSIP